MNKGENYRKPRKKRTFILVMLILLISGTMLALAEGKEQEQEEECVEEMQMPQIICPKPDGQNGWYLEAPEITVIHTEPEAMTCYRFTDASGNITEGELEWEAETSAPAAQILPEMFREGKNCLELSMVSREDGEELFHEKREILLDLTLPEEPEIQIPSYPDGNNNFFHTGIEVKIKSEDKVSGVEEIYVLLTGSEPRKITGNEGIIEIEPGYEGRISAYALDGSGRKSKVKVTGILLCEDEPPEAEMRVEGEFGVWRRKGVEVEVHIEDQGRKYKAASGLRTVTCRVGSKVVEEKSWDMEGESVFSDTLRFYVTQSSVKGRGIPVTVHVSDRAGNISFVTKELYIDLSDPAAEVTGVRDGQVFGENRKVVFTVSDENLLRDCGLTVSRTDINGTEERTERYDPEDWNGTGQEKNTEMNFSEDGRYVCTVRAKDASGRRAERTVTFVIDKTDPVIRYIEQLDGSCIPFFQWNYGNEMIRDLTENSHVMYLNGKRYFPGMKITAEGVYLLEIRARDMAGNEAAASAVFTIDHTEPVIYWGELRDGAVYTDKALLTVWVEGRGERIKSLEINGERQQLEYESRIFQYEITEPGKYTVRVQAEDEAGNCVKEKITFEVREQKGILPVLFPTKESYVSKNREGEVKVPLLPAAVILLAAAAGGAACLAGRKRFRSQKKNKRSGKTERNRV